MKKIFLVLVSFLFLIPISLAQVYDFSVWAEGPGFFTVGDARIVNIYINNTGNAEDSYTITPNKNVINPPGANNLVQIYLPSDRINSVNPGRAGNTFATVTLIGPVRDAEIWFTITSVNAPLIKDTRRIEIKSDYPISLPEFRLVGFLLLLLLSTLIISYSSHFR